MSATQKLFAPITVGVHNISHRIVLAPLSRMRNTEDGVPQAHCVEYYEQRTTENGLMISEATSISPASKGYTFAPGIYTDAQVEGWIKVVEAIHAKGGVIFNQLWHVGRAGSTDTVSASAVPIKGTSMWGKDYDVPRALTVDEIQSTIKDYVDAARNSMRAGFDGKQQCFSIASSFHFNFFSSKGVEIHAANGYLLDQFINTSSNFRTDKYGGSIQNRTRFVLEVIDAVVEAIGAKKVAVRLSPWSEFQDMKGGSNVFISKIN